MIARFQTDLQPLEIYAGTSWERAEEEGRSTCLCLLQSVRTPLAIDILCVAYSSHIGEEDRVLIEHLAKVVGEGGPEVERNLQALHGVHPSLRPLDQY